MAVPTVEAKEVRLEAPNGYNLHAWPDNAVNRGAKLYSLRAVVNTPKMEVSLKLYYHDFKKKTLYLSLFGYTSQYGNTKRRVIEVPIKGFATRKGKYKIPHFSELEFNITSDEKVIIDVDVFEEDRDDIKSFFNLLELLPPKN